MKTYLGNKITNRVNSVKGEMCKRKHNRITSGTKNDKEKKFQRF